MWQVIGSSLGSHTRSKQLTVFVCVAGDRQLAAVRARRPGPGQRVDDRLRQDGAAAQGRVHQPSGPLAGGQPRRRLPLRPRQHHQHSGGAAGGLHGLGVSRTGPLQPTGGTSVA